mgnify:FL=1
MKVTIFDYTVGNVHSLAKAFSIVGADVTIETKLKSFKGVDLLVLPGVGAFDPAAETLNTYKNDILENLNDGLACFGVCLGMQIKIEKSEEGELPGLGIIKGEVRKIESKRTPHMGWNDIYGNDKILKQSGMTNGYYANSFVCQPEDDKVVVALSKQDNDEFPAIVKQDNITGVQFHPEKSSVGGINFLREYVRSLS